MFFWSQTAQCVSTIPCSKGLSLESRPLALSPDFLTWYLDWTLLFPAIRELARYHKTVAIMLGMRYKDVSAPTGLDVFLLHMQAALDKNQRAFFTCGGREAIVKDTQIPALTGASL